jgi:hypothetical protein
MAHSVQPSFRKPRSGYLESIITAHEGLAVPVAMDFGFLVLLGPEMTGGVL